MLGGGEIELAELRGKVVVVNLWASWCPPCRTEMPALQKVYERNKDRGLEILAVNMTYQDHLDGAQDFVRQLGLTFKVPLDNRGVVSRLYQLRALPSTFFIDRQGIIREVIIGSPMSESTIQSALEELLEEGP